MPTKWIVAVVSGTEDFWSQYDDEERARREYEEDSKNPNFTCVTLAKVVSSESCK